MHDNVTKTYRKCNNDKTKTINIKAKEIASKLKLEDRIQILDDNDAYISIKDHKEGFLDKILCCLINPSKTDRGKISKQMFDKVNTSILEKVKVNQWKNTSSVIEWYCNIKRKEQCSFVVFDIESFYPSISEKLLDKAISFAKSHYSFTSDELEIVLHSRKTRLFWNQSTWVKKHGIEDFDIPIGCYHEAEILELVGIYIQSKLCKLMNKKDFGLYRDDRLGIPGNTSGREADRKRKSMTKVFKECGLSITCEVNKKIVDFLDVRFNLNDLTYEPYRKSNNDHVYINKHSNHPPNIINEVPKAISKRLTSIPCNKNLFDRNIGIYNTALKNSGFDQTLTCDEQDEPTSDSVNEESNQTRKRKPNIIRYNPSYSMDVKTTVSKIFSKLLRKHFSLSHPMYTIFNTNKVKISYSCFPNISSITSSHNKNFLYSDNTEYGYNCNDKNKCPLDNKCLTPRIVYRADVTNDQTQEQNFLLWNI